MPANRRRWFWPGLGIACLAGVGVAYEASIPHVGRATPAEILALVPRDLREAPPGDPAAEARLAAAVALAASPGPYLPKRLAALLDEGPWRVPEGEPLRDELERRAALYALGSSLCNELERIRALSRRPTDRDRADLGRTARLALRLVDVYDHAGGGGADARAVNGMLATVKGSILEANEDVGLLKADVFAILRTLPKGGGRSDRLAAAVAHDFRTDVLPRLIRAASGREGIDAVYREIGAKPPGVGSYDPLETTRLFVEFARLDQLAVRRGPKAIPALAAARAKAMLDALPVDPPASAGLWTRIRFRWAADHGPNTLGRAWAVPAKLAPLGELGEYRAWDRERLRYTLARFTR